VKFAIETYRGRYRYFAKHHGARSARQLRFVVLVSLLLRLVSRGVARCLSANPEKLHLYESTKLLLKWNFQLSVDRFLEYDEEPNIGVERMRPPGI
jgi:hypothetical protein